MAEEGGFEDIFPARREYKAQEPRQKKIFQPWHRLRKQYVRERQWCKALDALLASSPIVDRPIKYLGLPGNELLDLRIIHKVVCEPRKIPLRFIGFNLGAKVPGPDQLEIDLSTEEVKRLSLVDGQSRIVPDDFRTLADTNSVGWSEADRHGPFDVINIDLCDGFGKEPAGNPEETYYNAVSELLGIQAYSRSPWLLFLTTRIGERHVHPTTLSRMRTAYERNLRSCPEFTRLSKSRFRIATPADAGSALRSPAGFNNVFLTGLAKWLLGMGLNVAPKCQVTMEDVLSYTVRTGNPVSDLVSAAFLFEPLSQPPRDPLSLASSRRRKIVLDECALAAAFIEKLCSVVDVDKKIQADPALRSGLLQSAKDLMQAARYDVQEFSTWAAQNC